MSWRVVCWSVVRRVGPVRPRVVAALPVVRRVVRRLSVHCALVGPASLVPGGLAPGVIPAPAPIVPMERAMDGVVFHSPQARAAIEAASSMPAPVPEPWTLCLLGAWVLFLALVGTRRSRWRR